MCSSIVPTIQCDKWLLEDNNYSVRRLVTVTDTAYPTKNYFG